MTTEQTTLPSPRASVLALLNDAIAVRRDLHRHPELSTEEHRTQQVILERLRALGLDDVRAVAGTGATALVRGGQPGPNILWRADIDALPIEEATGLEFASENEGVMHACAHDGHVAIALALAEALQASRASLRGSVRFAFQPAEERIGGAVGMIEAGVMDDPPTDAVYGLHIWSTDAAGTLSVVPGPIFAAATHMRIIVRGRGGHASAPQTTIDPIVVAAHVIVALQTVVSRSVDPAETAVLTIGRIEGGARGNIIPDEVKMSGTMRTFEPQVSERMIARVEQIVAGVTAAWGAEYRFDHSTLPAVVNDARCAGVVEAVGRAFLGDDHVSAQRITGADDMAYYLQRAPGAYFLLGAADPAGRPRAHHSAQFDFDERAIGLGIEVALRIIETETGSKLG
ncbi:MAG TPA: M20 family metallopeptidase [Dehalococcoidia bacterium]|nr:M20 family metallopeptidase [Dehalococcoidia bacterium]